MNERMLLIGEYLKGERPMTDLCLEFGVSRKTAYKWVARYNQDGPAGLADRSRAPLSPIRHVWTLSWWRRCWRRVVRTRTGVRARSLHGS